VGDDELAGEDSWAGQVRKVAAGDLEDLLPLMRAYCDFYEVDPSDEDLLALSRALIADPSGEGVQLIARGAAGEALGFATVYWSWSTARAARLGVINDLFVLPGARGNRIAERLIAACVERAREHGAKALEWETALDNASAQALYDRIGAVRERWLSYSLELREQG
jgi:ribosomal protein S18 acetylase RimI-like enzyme